MKEHLFQAVETQRAALTAMADSIFDDPELGFQEFHAQKKLTDYLTQNGFQVETGTGGVETAFRAEFRNGQGGPRIGRLSVFWQSMTLCPWDTAAATTCRVPPLWELPRR